MNKPVSAPSLAQQILLWILPLAFLAFLFGASLQLYFNHQRLQQLADEHLNYLASESQQQINLRLQALQNRLYLLADNDLIQAGLFDAKKRQRYLPTLLHSQGQLTQIDRAAHLALLDHQGRPLLSNERASIFVSQKVPVPTSAKQLPGPQVYWSEAGMNIRVPIYFYDYLEGILSYSLDQPSLQQWFQRFNQFRQGMAIYSGEKRLLANATYLQHQATEEVLLVETRPLDFAQTHPDSPPLQLKVSFPQAHFFADHQSSYYEIFWVYLLTLVLLTLALLLGTRWLTRPLRDLEAQMQTLATSPDQHQHLTLQGGSSEVQRLVALANAAFEAFEQLHQKQRHFEQEQEFSRRIAKLTQYLPGMLYQYQLWPDGHSCFPYTSKGIETIYGVTPEEAQQSANPVFAIIHPDDRDEMSASIQQSAENLTKWSAEFRVYPQQDAVHKNKMRWLAGQAYPERQADGSILWHGYVQNITERKLYQAAITESELRFRQFAENTDLAFWVRSRHEILYVNPAYEVISGHSLQSLYENPNSFLELIHPDDKDQVRQKINATEAQGLPFDGIYRILRADKQVRWIHVKTYPVQDDCGDVLRMAGIAQDVTGQVEMEQALQTSNAELEQFAYVASHDLRQPLRMINSYLQLLEKHLQGNLNGDQKQMLDFARNGARRLDQMLISLLEYSRVGRKGQPMQRQSAWTALEEALAFLHPQTKESDAQLEMPPETHWPEVYASRDEMTRLFQNLIGNAVKYHQPDKPPEITLDIESQGDFWQFSVCDQGIGIDPRQFDRLFKVFQRLQSRTDYEGTGIGLAVARKIVERHGGQIWVASRGLGKGSCFYFTLPKLQTLQASSDTGDTSDTGDAKDASNEEQP